VKLKDYLDNPFEFFWGFCAQFLIILIVKWWALPVMVLCGLLWRLGGVTGGIKLARRIGVPLVLCGATFLKYHQFGVFAAAPLMIWGCPWSYGDESWLFIQMKEFTGDQEKADLYTRFILFVWYWTVFLLSLRIPF